MTWMARGIFPASAVYHASAAAGGASAKTCLWSGAFFGLAAVVPAAVVAVLIHALR